MKFKVIILILLICSALSISAQTVESTIDQYLTIRSEMGNFSGAVLVAKDGKVIFRKGYGFADVEKRIPYTPETQHAIASVSKMFTSAAALKLRDQGKLKLEDPICKYLDDCPTAWQPVTVQNLMRHTSGIPDYEEKLELGSEKYLQMMAEGDTSARIYAEAKKLPLDFKPGEKFHYSNTGYVVLSYLVQKVAKMPFAGFVTKNILQPAGMKNTGIFGVGKYPKNLAVGYTYGDLGWEKTLAGFLLTDGTLKKQPPITISSPHGDAMLYSTLDDLYRWSQMMEGGKLIPKVEVDEIYTAGLEDYGYGWFIGQGFNRKRARHNGMLPGFLTDFIRFPDEKTTIIIFSNIDRTRLNSVSRDVTSIILGTPFDMPVRGKVIKLSPEQIANLEGDYKMKDGRILNIKNEPDFLTAKLKDFYTAGLIPLSPTEFYFPLADGKAIFTLDQNGKVSKVNMRYSGEDHLAERVKN
ncbi:MAG TPA: serine hydrolase domain-containing protein [Pyrinomonadaceae bacterium]|nr:serine hydrolase domain-containing protein [Pyrinomonadaceae bacterium]